MNHLRIIYHLFVMNHLLSTFYLLTNRKLIICLVSADLGAREIIMMASWPAEITRGLHRIGWKTQRRSALLFLLGRSGRTCLIDGSIRPVNTSHSNLTNCRSETIWLFPAWNYTWQAQLTSPVRGGKAVALRLKQWLHLKQNNFTETKTVLRFFCFSFVSVLFQL